MLTNKVLRAGPTAISYNKLHGAAAASNNDHLETQTRTGAESNNLETKSLQRTVYRGIEESQDNHFYLNKVAKSLLVKANEMVDFSDVFVRNNLNGKRVFEDCKQYLAMMPVTIVPSTASHQITFCMPNQKMHHVPTESAFATVSQRK